MSKENLKQPNWVSNIFRPLQVPEAGLDWTRRRADTQACR